MSEEEQSVYGGNYKIVQAKENKITLEEDQVELNGTQRFLNIGSDSSQPDFQKLFNLPPVSILPQMSVVDQFQCIFREKKFRWKSGNTPRKMMEMILDYFISYRYLYPRAYRRRIFQICKKLREWHLAERNNVFKMEHIEKFFVEMQREFPGTDQLNRQVFNMILREHSLSSMKKPRSQIKNKVEYLRVLKVFSLRCRSKKLISRNQAR